MPPLLKRLLPCAAADGEGNDLPGGDYGDDFTPTEDDGAEKKAATQQKRLASEKGDSEGAADDDEDDGAAADLAADLREIVEDPAEGAADAKDTGTPKAGKGKFIPLDRHEKLLKKERARREELEAQLSQSRAGQQMASVNEDMSRIEDTLVNMEEKYNDLLAEGDTKGAAALMTQIRRKNAELNALASQQRDAEVMARAVEKVRYDEALDRIEDAYPELREGSDEFDADVFQDVVDLMQAGRARGLTPTKALQRAVERVMGATTSAQKRATTTTPRVSEDDVASRRRADAVKRNVDVAGRTPPASHRVTAGDSGGKLTAEVVMGMSDEDFAKLKEEDLARLRGDIL